MLFFVDMANIGVGMGESLRIAGVAIKRQGFLKLRQRLPTLLVIIINGAEFVAVVRQPVGIAHAPKNPLCPQ